MQKCHLVNTPGRRPYAREKKIVSSKIKTKTTVVSAPGGGPPPGGSSSHTLLDEAANVEDLVTPADSQVPTPGTPPAPKKNLGRRTPQKSIRKEREKEEKRAKIEAEKAKFLAKMRKTSSSSSSSEDSEESSSSSSSGSSSSSSSSTEKKKKKKKKMKKEAKKKVEKKIEMKLKKKFETQMNEVVKKTVEAKMSRMAANFTPENEEVSSAPPNSPTRASVSSSSGSRTLPSSQAIMNTVASAASSVSPQVRLQQIKESKDKELSSVFKAPRTIRSLSQVSTTSSEGKTPRKKQKKSKVSKTLLASRIDSNQAASIDVITDITKSQEEKAAEEAQKKKADKEEKDKQRASVSMEQQEWIQNAADMKEPEDAMVSSPEFHGFSTQEELNNDAMDQDSDNEMEHEKEKKKK